MKHTETGNSKPPPAPTEADRMVHARTNIYVLVGTWPKTFDWVAQVHKVVLFLDARRGPAMFVVPCALCPDS